MTAVIAKRDLTINGTQVLEKDRIYQVVGHFATDNESFYLLDVGQGREEFVSEVHLDGFMI